MVVGALLHAVLRERDTHHPSARVLVSSLPGKRTQAWLSWTFKSECLLDRYKTTTGLGAARGLQAHPILPGLVLGETKDGGNSESFLE